MAIRHAFVAAVLVLVAGPAGAEPGDDTLERFLQARGENVEACFAELPELDASFRDAAFEGGDVGAPCPRDG